MKRLKIKNIQPSDLGKTLTLCGWVRTVREQKSFTFLEINDGSTLSNFQIILDADLADYAELIKQLSTGASLRATGTLVESPGSKQKWEMKASAVQVLGTCPEDYPLQKKRHSFEFLRTIAHLRPRTNTQGAVMRVRNALAFATHLFFQERGFLYIQTPIITASDCEGGGEQFSVTTLDVQNKTARLFSKTFSANPPISPSPASSMAKHGLRPLRCLHLRPHLPRRKLQHLAPPRRILDDRTRNGLCRSQQPTWTALKTISNMSSATSSTHCTEDMEFFDQFIEKGSHRASQACGR